MCVCVYMYTSFHFVAFIFDVTHSGPRSRKLTTDSGEVASSTKGIVASVSAGLHELYRSEQVPSGKLTGRNGISPFSIGNTIFIQDPFRLVDTRVYATGAYVSSHSDPLQNAHLAPTHPAQVVKTQAALNPGIIGNLSPRRKCTPTSMSKKLLDNCSDSKKMLAIRNI